MRMRSAQNRVGFSTPKNAAELPAGFELAGAAAACQMKRKREEDDSQAPERIAVLPAPPSAAEFHERHVRRSVPAVIRGALQGWPALERWQRAGYFADSAPAAFRDSQITVAAAQDAVYSGDPKQQDSIMMKWYARRPTSLPGVPAAAFVSDTAAGTVRRIGQVIVH